MLDAQTRVGLFAMCLVDEIMPEIGMAAIRLLRLAELEVVFAASQTCCG